MCMVAYMYMHATLRKSNKITGRMDVDYDGVDASGVSENNIGVSDLYV